jgi:anti-sigma regulatory factor (Ser/Thr protein kinase)
MSADGLTGFVEASLPAEARYLSLARKLCSTVALEGGFSREESFDAALALSEALAILVKHADASWTTVRLAVDPVTLRIEVEDDGAGVDRDIVEDIERPEGPQRLGLRVMLEVMDQVEVQSGPAGGTLLRMAKLRSAQPLTTPRDPRPSLTAGHIRKTLRRYERDLALMQGRTRPSDSDLDDLAILERFASTEDRDSLINDRKLRIKTLQATLEILRDELGTEEA